MNEQEKYEWMVYVSCMTFNQAPYIEDAMNGFTMQKTEFPFVCAIVDDASTDGEQEVIKNYLNEHFDLGDKSIVRHEETDDYVLTFARHKTNLNCHFAVFYLKYNHYSIKKNKVPYLIRWRDKAKYLALCEGDDYWTNSEKLQIQVDYLESHDECNLVYTDISTICQKDGTMTEGFFGHGAYSHIKNTHRDMVLWGWFLAPCTWVYRNRIIHYPKQMNPKMFYGDIYTVLSLTENGTIHFINERTAVYRIFEESASHSKDPFKKFSFWKRGRSTRLYFASKQSLAFRLKWIVINDAIAVRNIFRNRNFKIAYKAVSMMLGEIYRMFNKV